MDSEIYGPYILLRRVTGDGLSEIFAARCELMRGLHRDCLLRRLEIPDGADLPSATVLDEIRVTVRLDHPSLIRVLDCGTVADTLYIESEYVDGVPLRRILDLSERLSPAEAVAIACSLAEALDYLHRATAADGRPMRLVHRNLMPENVLLTPSGEIKVGGFGLAHYVDRKMSITTMEIRGRLGYISPEQIDGKPPHPRSDLFSLGILLYEMLSGQSPFPGPAPGKVFDQIVSGSYPPMEEFVELPIPGLGELVGELLQVSPLERPADVRVVWLRLWSLRKELGGSGEMRGLRARAGLIFQALEPPVGG